MTIDVAHRRARLALRHRLASPATTSDELADNLVGLHSSDPITPYLAAWARRDDFAVGELDDALYARRSLVRMLGMRRTVFVVSRDVATSMQAGCTQSYVAAERERLAKMLEVQEVSKQPKRWLAKVERDALAALAARGEATATDLVGDVPALGRKLTFGVGKTWENTVSVGARVLYLLAMRGQVLRVRPLGTWVSSQYRWARTDDWIDGGLPELDASAARADLARRYLHAFGPATEADVKWWTGWTVRDTRAALAAIEAVEVELDGGDNGAGFVLPDDVGSVEPPDRWVALLPGLDPTVMGWTTRGWYLANHQPELFDSNGNAGCTVWLDGRVVGGWAQRPDGSIAVELVEPVDRDTGRRITAETERLADWLGETRIVGRFRTPMERRLVG